MRCTMHLQRAGILALLVVSASCARRIPIANAPGAHSSLTAQLGLLAADRVLAETTVRSDVVRGLASRFASDVVLLAPGRPVSFGVESARAMIDSTSTSRLWWIPLYAEVSSDSTFGTTYGVTIARDAADANAPPTNGRYLTMWRRTSDGWRIASLVVTAGLPLRASRASVSSGSRPAMPTSGAAAEFAQADRDFAALAGRNGAAPAFAAYAAPDGVTFPAGGDIARGPDAIAARLRDFAAVTHWEWTPIAAAAAGSGDLGFTVGEATIRPRGGQAGETYYTKYLSVWRRLPDGRIGFVADLGNARNP
jgi:ketosteroid isomerase-like protein